jgi:hypothetical protein
LVASSADFPPVRRLLSLGARRLWEWYRDCAPVWLLEAPLPLRIPTGQPARTWRISVSAFGNAVFVVFALVQLADGILTYLGIITFGTDVEANPLIARSIAAFGAGAALIGAKTIAVVCAMVLHLTARHYIISALTVGYLLTAIWPWTRLVAF